MHRNNSLSVSRISMTVLAIFLSCCLLSEGINAQESPKRNVLMLNSYHLGLGVNSYPLYRKAFDDAFENVEIYYEFMDTRRFLGDDYFELMKDLYQRKLSEIQFDVIIASDDNALNFLLKYRDELFGKVPVVFGGINDLDIDALNAQEAFTGIIEDLDVEPTLDFILDLQPGTEHIAVVHDATETGMTMKKVVEDVQVHYAGIGFDYVSGDDYDTQELVQYVSKLPDNTAILLLIWTRDKSTISYTQKESARLIATKASVPTYCVADHLIGYGPVGGLVQKSNAQHIVMADYGVRILKGEQLSNLPLISPPFNETMVDHDQLVYWGLDVSKIPVDSVILNRPPSFYAMNRVQLMMIFMIFTLLSMAVVSLLVYIFFKRKLNRSIMESEERYRTLFETSRDALHITRTNGDIIDVNQSFLNLFGYTREEAIGIKAESLYRDGVDRFKIVTALVTEGYLENSPVKLKDKNNNPIEALYTANVRYDDNGNPLFFHINTQDISERKRLEAQLAQSQKMESIGRLAGGIAHDFNNILTAIIGNAELAVSTLEPGSQLYMDLSEIKSSADRAATLTKQLLAFSRRQIAAPKSLNLNDALKGMDSMLRRLIGEDVGHETVFAENIWNVFIDPGQIEQVLVNLVVNARDAIVSKGTIRVGIVNMVIDLELHQNQEKILPGEYVMLSVSDDGEGMTEAVKDNIFEPFYTTKDVGKGTGLGLSTCYGIVKQNKGFINVYSEVDHGTTIKVFLPRYRGESAIAEDVELPETAPTGTENVIVVEDEDSVRTMIVRLLTEYGYTVLDASNGAEALDILQASDVEPELMITDVVMSNMGGYELYENVSRLYPGLKVIFMSGYDDKSLLNTSMELTDLTTIQKPFARELLLSKIREVLG